MPNLSTEQEAPLFTHDSDCCTFLGTHEGKDLYWCDQGGNLPTVLVRYGNDGPEYYSGWPPFGWLANSLFEAGRRAQARGLRMPT